MSIPKRALLSRCGKPPPLARPAFRKRLPPRIRNDISLLHHSNLDVIARGGASEVALWDWVAAVTMWQYISERLGVGEAEMQPQIALAEKMILHFASTSKVEFELADYQTAREGVVVMDLLAGEVDLVTAAWAAECSDKAVKHRSACLQAPA